MRKELTYFEIGAKYGGNQNWLRDPMMHFGGCAALAACDSSIYFTLHKNAKGICPMDILDLNKQDYIRFSQKMKPYLKPRLKGIDRLEIYVEGFGQYLRDCGNYSINMEGFAGSNKTTVAKQKVREQIDAGMVIPFLMLKHKDTALKDYVWHWFLLTGYEEYEDVMMVKAVTYGSYQWLDFDNLWDTGYTNKGGMILYSGF